MRLDEQGRTRAQVIRERRLLRAAEREGTAFGGPKQQVPVVSSERPPRTLSEAIRWARLKKRLKDISTMPTMEARTGGAAGG